MTDAYYADDLTLTVNDSAGTEIAVAGLKGVTIELEAEHIELFTTDSIEREAVKKRELSVPIEIEWALWDEAFVQAWMAGDSTATGQTTVADTSDVAIFDIDGTVTSVDGSKTLQVTVEDVYFESFPVWDAQEGEFIMQNASGTGKTISDLSVQA